MPIYKDDRNVITPLFDQIRRITETEDAMTFERATESLLNVTPGDELPSAEESSFGVDTADTETGIKTLSTESQSTNSNMFTLGWKFTATEAFSIIGFRQKQNNAYVKYMRLWDSSGNIVASIDTWDKATDWVSYYFDTPINVAIGETYTVSVCTYYFWYASRSGTTFNSKLGNIQCVSSANNQFPTGTDHNVYNIDIIIAPIVAELPNDYQIQRTTMDDIAEEVQRITGVETKLTVDDIQSGLESVVLQEKSVTPSTEPLTIIPDAGYYGISKVTVGAVEESGGSSMFVGSASGILPTVYKGTANSEFALNFESSATGALQEG